MTTCHEHLAVEVLEVQVRFQHTVKQLYFQNEDHVLKKLSSLHAYEFQQFERQSNHWLTASYMMSHFVLMTIYTTSISHER